MDYNATSDDLVIKTTINFPKTHVLGAKSRMRHLGLKHFSTYLNALIRMDLEARHPMSLKEFLGYYETPAETAAQAIDRISRQAPRIRAVEPRRYIDPPRRYPGFIAGLLKGYINTRHWFNRRNEEYKWQTFNQK